MKRTIRHAAWACIPGLCLVVGTGCPRNPPDDDDDDEKPPPGCKYATGQSRQDFRKNPIPAGFFDFDGRSCEPFDDTISYTGQALDEPESDTVDTIVHRDRDPISPFDPVGTEETVDIEIVTLGMTSTEPITVLCDGDPTEWNVSVDLSEAAAPKGTLTAIKGHANGGTASSTVFIYLRLTFVNLDDPSVVRVFDMAAEGLDPVQLDATFPWAHALDPSDPDPGTEFLVGVDSPPGAVKQPIPGVIDSTTLQGANTRCAQYVSSSGDYVYEACAIDSDGGT
ncbi:MAG: hypothetical protein ACYTFA_11445 [Planctomycetota bacterium]|jgi:hypothetical protein